MCPADAPIEERGDPEARYANYCKVGHNAYEFLIDFGQLYANERTAALHTRIVTNPGFAKDMLETLAASVDAYERQFGVIEQS